MKKYFVFALVLVMNVACSGGDSSSTKAGSSGPAPLLPANASSTIIDNEDLTAGIRGVDANQNGIRDDIDRLIAKKYSTTADVKKAVEQEARALQTFMEATTRQQALAAGDENFRATLCLMKHVSPSTALDDNAAVQASREIEALTANTRERFEKYWNSNKLAGGGVFSAPAEPVCD